MGSTGRLSWLSSLDEDQSATVRGVAACALGEFDNKEARAALEKAQ